MRLHPSTLLVAALALAGVLACLLFEPPWLSTWRDQVFDQYQRLAPRTLSGRHVPIVAIDDESLVRHGQWPWSRQRLAALLTKLQAAGAAVVAFDILFSEQERAQAASTESEPSLGGDAALARALAAGRAVTAFVLLPERNGAAPRVKADFEVIGTDPIALLPKFGGALVARPLLEEAARGNGAVNVALGDDGVVRALPLVLRFDNTLAPSLIAETLRIAQGFDHYLVRGHSTTDGDPSAPQPIEFVEIGAFTIPTTAFGEVRLYLSDPRAREDLPAWRVLAGEVDPKALRGALVLVGATATGLRDSQQTPLGVAMPGVGIHGQAIEQIIDETYLVRPRWAKACELTFVLATAGLLVALGARVGAIITGALGLLAVTAIGAVSWYTFSVHRLLLDAAGPAAASFVVWLCFSVAKQVQVEREERWIRKAFNSYVAPKVVRELIEHPDHLKLSGERRDLSFVYTDLEGFTALIESSEPERVLPILNAYLDGLVRIAFESEGTVDKIVGDAVHVIFGAPVAIADHADRAVACALRMCAFAKDFARRQRSDGFAFGRTRIGINSGPATVGNFGGDLRFTYTAHGDAVNTAARLEGANRILGTNILVSGATVERCVRFQGRPAATLRLKGKQHWVRVFEPLSDGDEAIASLDAYREAYDALVNQDPETARSRFSSLLAQSPKDPLVEFHWQRLREGDVDDKVILDNK